jgi:hypothetical protein
MYDILYASRDKILEQDWTDFKSRFPRAIRCDNVETFDDLKSKSFTKFFWIVWDDLEIVDDFKFDYTIPEWDRTYTHLFLNGDEYNGVVLISKDIEVSKKEIEFRFFLNYKPIEIIASRFKKYDIIGIGNVDENLKNKFPRAKTLPETATLEEIKQTSSTKMFWIVWHDVIVNDDFDFSYRAATYADTKQIHAFKNGNYYDGICLFPKDVELSQREFAYKFFADKKETGIQASLPKPYDIVFISYNEPNADENYKLLCEKFPRAKRVDKVKGIHQAHIEAAKLSTTDVFWVVDADAIVVDGFNFDHIVSTYDKETVQVWRSRNPINDLEYGYGGVKLLPKKLTLNMDVSRPDMTTSISKQFNAVPIVSNITAFNTDPFSTWKSAFRECVKLASGIIVRNKEKETLERLETWCTVGNDRDFGIYCIAGANAGKLYGESNKDNPTMLNNINDFDWLKQEFEKEFPQ